MSHIQTTAIHAVYSFIVTVFLLTLSTSTVQAEDIKERMRERLPQITQLKTSGLLGENNQGFLEFLQDATANQELIKQENKDRLTVYSAIAKKQNTTPAFVGQRRAAQIVERAAPGTMLQDPSGKWFKK